MGLITYEYFTSLPLGLSKSAKPDPTTVTTFIESASVQVKRYCDRDFELTDYTDEEIKNITRFQREFIVRQWPLNSVTNITCEDSLGNITTIDPSLYKFDANGVVRFINYTLDPTCRYFVSYNAGYAALDIPGSIQHATALWAMEFMQPDFVGPRTDAPSVLSVSSEQIIELLDPFKRKSIG